MILEIGTSIINTFKKFSYGAGFFFTALKNCFLFGKQRHIGGKVLVMQILFTGVEALSVITLLGLVVGVIIVVQGLSFLPQLGQSELIYKILVTVISKELGPLLTAFIIVARSATAISTELGNMVVSHEIEAYISVGIDPMSYLIVPRFLGVTLSVIILNLYFNIAGLVGSFFITQFIENITFSEYFRNLLTVLKPSIILESFIKSLVFGLIISFSATYNGFKVEGATTEIPQVVIKSVSQGFMFCIVANVIITTLGYLWG